MARIMTEVQTHSGEVSSRGWLAVLGVVAIALVGVLFGVVDGASVGAMTDPNLAP